MRVPAGSSTMPVRLERSGGCGAQAVNRRKTRQAECLPHLVRAMSDHLNGNRREAAPAQAHATLMRARLYGFGQHDVAFITPLHRTGAKGSGVYGGAIMLPETVQPGPHELRVS